MTAVLQPIPKQERAEILDVLRGFALLGIFIANLNDFTFYWLLNQSQKINLPLSQFDPWAEFLQSMLITGKFYSIFSLLFGIGFAIYLSKSDQDPSVLITFRRRLFILLSIGFFHLLFWIGDIVAFYALLGFVLIPFRRFSNKKLLVIGILCILSPICWYALKMSNPLVFDLSQWLFKLELKLTSKMGLTSQEDFYKVFHGTDLVKRISVNFIGILYRYAELIFQSRAFKVFGMFLIGLVIGRTGFYKNLSLNKKLLWRILVAGFMIGLPANFVMAKLSQLPGYAQLTLHGLKQTIAYALGVVPLALAYAAAIALLYLHNRIKKGLIILAPVGRMALTNYLMQTLIGVFTFSNLGFGFNPLGPAAWTIFAVVVFCFQIFLSTIWLQYYQFGPLEWIWRQLTYGKHLPLIKQPEQTKQPA